MVNNLDLIPVKSRFVALVVNVGFQAVPVAAIMMQKADRNDKDAVTESAG
jgi:hypothetical protein